MRNVWLGMTLLSLVGSVSSGMAAQPTSLPTVPAGLSSPQTKALTQERASILAEGEKLQSSVEAHHAKCAHVGLPPASGQTPDPNEAALKEECDAEQAQIDAAVHRYADDARAYRAAVDAAIAGTATAKNAYAARVVLKGGVQLMQPSGTISLTSSRVVQLATGERITTGQHARASFQLPDKSQFVLGPQTEVSLISMINGSPSAKRQIALGLTKGVLHWTSGADTMGRAAQVSIELTAGSVSLGPCDVQASAASDGGYVALFKGQARITGKTKSNSTIDLRAGQIASYSSTGIFTMPRPLQPKEVQTP